LILYTVLSYTSIGGSIALLAAMISVIAYPYIFKIHKRVSLLEYVQFMSLSFIIYGFQRHLLLPVADYPIINWEHIPLFMGNAAFLFCDHVIV